ncbi:MAG: hypothetical protein RL038_350, partial [Actinomycetota bacterium]
MSNPRLINALSKLELVPAWTAVVDAPSPLDVVAPIGLRPWIVAALAKSDLVLAITATGREAEDLVDQLHSFLPADAVAEFVSWETLPHERLSPSSDVIGRRLAVLRRLRHAAADSQPPIQVVVAPIRAILQPLVSGISDLAPVQLRKGDERDFDAVISDLAAAGYARVDLVEKRGQFAVRGGLVDVFPPSEEHPLRIEFWGDTVEEIRTFAV